jgi:tetratricopeptide (TPR) repeat protein
MAMGANGSDLSLRLLLFDSSARAARLRRRGGAAAGAALLVLGLLAALGFATLALGLVLLVGAVAAASQLRDRERRQRLQMRLAARGRLIRRRAETLVRASGRHGAEEPTVENATAGRPGSSAVDEEAGYRCQTLGTLMRRRGRAEEAATLHEAARLIFVEAGDPRGEAVATNGLGLALFSAGRREASFAQFEQARRLLRAVGDREPEARVTANLALAKLRSGATEEATELLRRALEHLTPNTPDYRRVEERLREAS